MDSAGPALRVLAFRRARGWRERVGVSVTSMTQLSEEGTGVGPVLLWVLCRVFPYWWGETWERGLVLDLFGRLFPTESVSAFLGFGRPRDGSRVGGWWGALASQPRRRCSRSSLISRIPSRSSPLIVSVPPFR